MDEKNQATIYQREAFAIRDIKANVFTAPFIAGTSDEARRIFGDMCYFGGDNLIARHPSDYLLYHVGYFDINTGKLTPVDGLPTLIISALEIINVYKEQYKNVVPDSQEDSSTSISNSTD